jgi:hypothetical protein
MWNLTHLILLQLFCVFIWNIYYSTLISKLNSRVRRRQEIIINQTTKCHLLIGYLWSWDLRSIHWVLNSFNYAVFPTKKTNARDQSIWCWPCDTRGYMWRNLINTFDFSNVVVRSIRTIKWIYNSKINKFAFFLSHLSSYIYK